MLNSTSDEAVLPAAQLSVEPDQPRRQRQRGQPGWRIGAEHDAGRGGDVGVGAAGGGLGDLASGQGGDGQRAASDPLVAMRGAPNAPWRSDESPS